VSARLDENVDALVRVNGEVAPMSDQARSETGPFDREQRAREWIRVLSEIPERFAGTAAERSAAERTAEWMRGLGARDVSVVFWGQP
jgi:hypothetical protein